MKNRKKRDVSSPTRFRLNTIKLQAQKRRRLTAKTKFFKEDF